ncbi:helix-turn-helix domain-containing protein [Streptomyces werraensis]|uniref:Helix-turn-helix transcriptional regulator n=1 Tax=Streptomyces werraensis TaxID=68284 RepID=A0ABV3JSH8_9ACTN
MGQQPQMLSPDQSPAHLFGCTLREYRDARHYSLRGLAKKAFMSHSKLQKWEDGARFPRHRQEVEWVDSLLDAGGVLVDLWERLSADASRGGVSVSVPRVSDASLSLASAASQQATSDDEGIFVPARLRDGSVVFVSLDRRTMLRGGVGIGAAAALGTGTPAAASEVAQGLKPPPRSAAAYSGTPIEHLRRARRLLIDNDNLLGPRHTLATVREYIARIKELRHDAQGADRQALLELQTQYAEFASWLYQDLGAFDQAEFWLDRAFQWSHTVGDNDLTSYIMARKAQLAGERRDLVDIVDLAEAAQRMARPRSRLASVARTYESYGHALRGESTDSERAIDDVRNSLDRVSSDATPWGVWLTEQYVDVHRAQGLEVLGQHTEAAAIFTTAIKTLPEGYHRDRGVYLARAAVAHAGAGSPEEAAAAGLEALAVAEETGSGRITRELARLDHALVPWQRQPEVIAFREAFDATLVHEA